MALIVTVVAAGIDPPLPIWRPLPAPAAVVAIGADEGKAIEAVMEEAVMEAVMVPEREP
jgi:hypothetical protein